MPKDRDIPAFLFYPDDFSSDGKVEAMTTEEVGCYVLLLCKAWRETPPGSLPSNDTLLARWARVSSVVWSESKARVMAAFQLRADGRWHQKRMRHEYEKAVEIRKKRAIAGALGGRPPKGSEKANANQKVSKAIGIGIGIPNGERGAGRGPPETPSTWELKQQIDAIELKIDDVKARGYEDAFGMQFDDPEDRKELKLLKKKCKELNDAIARKAFR